MQWKRHLLEIYLVVNAISDFFLELDNNFQYWKSISNFENYYNWLSEAPLSLIHIINNLLSFS